MVRQLELQAAQRADHISNYLAQSEDMIQAMENHQTPLVARLVTQEVAADPGTVAAMCFDSSGQLLAQAGDPWPDPSLIARYFPQIFGGKMPPTGLMGHWSAGEYELFISVDPILDNSGARLGTVAGIMRLPSKLTQISSEIQQETQKYNELSQRRKAEKRTYVSMLGLLTLLILFIATWFALFFSKQVTVPIQALAPGYRNAFYRREVCDGVTVHRVWLYPAMGGGVERMLNYTSFAATSIYGLMRAEKPEFIFVESPPLFLAISAHVAGRLRGAPFIFSVADLWPDAIAEGGFLPDGFLLRCLGAIEKWSYRKAAYVNAVTEGIRDALLHKKSVAPEKVLFLPNGVDTIRYQPRREDATLKKELGLEGKRVILWAGTLGYAHGLENVLQAAPAPY